MFKCSYCHGDELRAGGKGLTGWASVLLKQQQVKDRKGTQEPRRGDKNFPGEARVLTEVRIPGVSDSG